MTDLTERADAGIDSAKIVAKILSDRSSEPLRLGQQEFDLINSSFEKVHLPPRAILEKGGQPTSKVWVIVNGLVRLSENARVVDIIDPPAIVGDDTALRHDRNPYTIRSVSNINALTISVPVFRKLVHDNPNLASAWLGELSAKLHYQRVRNSYLLSGDLTEQLAGLLLHRAKNNLVPLTQSTMAAMLNVHRASISRALHSLERQGTIDIGYASVSILDKDKLSSVFNR